MDPLAIKIALVAQLLQHLEQNIAETEQAIASAKESRDNESKSSAGDKYETGRAMMQIELENNGRQLEKTRLAKQDLEQLNVQEPHTLVSQGSLVHTSQGIYFLSIGFGKLEFAEQPYYAISLASPIGQALKNAKVGDRVSFQGKVLEILRIS
jgi:transcription elongation GreA/GreB family factor